MSPVPSLQTALQHLWQNNPALVKLLGLCPLLAVTQTTAQAVGLGLATVFVLVGSSTLASLSRYLIPDHLRLPVFVLIIAGFTTCATLIMQAVAFGIYQTMALFVQIIVTNCLILSRIESYSSRHPVLPVVIDSIMTGLGFMLALVLLGSLREIIAYGTLGSGFGLLFGGENTDGLRLSESYSGFLLAALPPGAFLGMGLLIALKNMLDKRFHQLNKTNNGPQPTLRDIQ